MAFCVHCDQKEQCFTVSSRKQSTGVHQRVDVFRVCPSFLYTCAGFLPELLGTHRHNAGGHRSRGFCFSFLYFFYIFILPPHPPFPLLNPPDLHPESRRRLEIAQTCSPSQSRGLLASSPVRLPRPCH